MSNRIVARRQLNWFHPILLVRLAAPSCGQQVGSRPLPLLLLLLLLFKSAGNLRDVWRVDGSGSIWRALFVCKTQIALGIAVVVVVLL
jgi:hypothetical protein